MNNNKGLNSAALTTQPLHLHYAQYFMVAVIIIIICYCTVQYSLLSLSILVKKRNSRGKAASHVTAVSAGGEMVQYAGTDECMQIDLDCEKFMDPEQLIYVCVN